MALTQAQIEALYASILQIDSTELTTALNDEIANLVAASTGGTSDAAIQASIVNSTLATTTIEPLLRVYQAAFGRKADIGGLNFFADQLRAGTTTIDAIATQFASSAEFATRFPTAATDTSAFVANLYTNVLGRGADTAGQTFWANSGLSAAQLLAAFAQSAEFVTRTAAAADSYMNARAAGTTLDVTEDLFTGAAGVPQITGTFAVEGVTGEANAYGTLTISDSDSNNATVTISSTTGGLINVTAGVGGVSYVTSGTGANGTSTVILTGTIAGINTALDGLTYTSNATAGTTDSFTIMVADSSGSSVTKTVTVTLAGLQDLTTSTDTITGTASSDAFRANAAGELVAADTITDSSSTDSDILIVDTLNTDTGQFTASGIETIRVTDTGAGTDIDVDLNNVTGVTTLENATASADDVDFDGLTSLSGVTLKVSGASTNTALDSDLSGSSDSLTLMLNGVTAAATVTLEDDVAAGGLETLTITGSGNNNGATTPVLSVITLADVASTATTINASAVADGLSLAGMGAADQTITLGAAGDTLNMGVNLSAGDVLDGGTGTNTLAVAVDNGGTLAGTDANISNFTILNVSTVGGGDVIIVDGDTVGTDFTRYNLTSLAVADEFTLNDLVNGANINIANAGATIAALTVDVKNDNTGASDSLTLTQSDADGVIITELAPAADLEALNIVADNALTITNAIGETVETITITGDSAVIFTGGVGSATVNASALTGALTVGGTTVASTITGGTANDTFTGGAALADTFIGGTGNDTFNFNMGGEDTMTGGVAETDTFLMASTTSTAANLSTITDFTVSATASVKDLLQLDLSSLNALTPDGVNAVTIQDGSGTAVGAAAAGTVNSVSADGVTLATAGADIIFLAGKTYANAAAALADIQTAGERTFTFEGGGTIGDNEGVVLAYELTGGGIQLAVAQNNGAGVANSGTMDSIDSFLTLTGVTAANFTSANFDYDIVA